MPGARGIAHGPPPPPPKARQTGKDTHCPVFLLVNALPARKRFRSCRARISRGLLTGFPSLVVHLPDYHGDFHVKNSRWAESGIKRKKGEERQIHRGSRFPHPVAVYSPVIRFILPSRRQCLLFRGLYGPKQRGAVGGFVPRPPALWEAEYRSREALAARGVSPGSASQLRLLGTVSPWEVTVQPFSHQPK